MKSRSELTVRQRRSVRNCLSTPNGALLYVQPNLKPGQSARASLIADARDGQNIQTCSRSEHIQETKTVPLSMRRYSKSILCNPASFVSTIRENCVHTRFCSVARETNAVICLGRVRCCLFVVVFFFARPGVGGSSLRRPKRLLERPIRAGKSPPG